MGHAPTIEHIGLFGKHCSRIAFEFLKKTDRFAKTIVFCVDQEHASEMRQILSNLNHDLVAQYPDYVCRVTDNKGEIGRGHLDHFQDVENKSPVILTTSQLVTTGVDEPTCKNIVLARVVGSMGEFKQIIGRGTRVRDVYGKLWFRRCPKSCRWRGMIEYHRRHAPTTALPNRSQ